MSRIYIAASKLAGDLARDLAVLLTLDGHEVTELGGEVHKQLEAWLKDGTPLDLAAEADVRVRASRGGDAA